MARYTKTIDIWTLDDNARAKLQPGQWVTAGGDGNKGRFWGQGRSTVVAWLGNARGHCKSKGGKGYEWYMEALRVYGKTISQKTKEHT